MNVTKVKNDKERLVKLNRCVNLDALRSEYQIVNDRLKGANPPKDDKQYSLVLKLEVAHKILQNLTFEAEIAKREFDITRRITKYKMLTDEMVEIEVENYVDRLKRDVEIFNKDIKDENVKRAALIPIVKKD